MKKSIFVLLIAALISISQLLDAADIDVFPTGDAAHDRANLHAALAGAAPGDTILLKAGVFNLTPPETDPTDCSLDVAIPLPGGDSMRFWDAFAKPDACNPDAPDIFTLGQRNMWELYLIDKPLTVKGEAGPEGPLTILRVENRFSDIFLPIFKETNDYAAAWDAAWSEADSYFFLIGAPKVTIENIEFDGPSTTIETFWAGTTIKDCVFRAVGMGPYIFPDERSIYPHYPTNFDEPIASYFTNNVFINAQQGIHIGGSEVIVSNNFFDHYGAFAVFLSAYASMTLPADKGGGGLPLVRALAQNNRIADNVIVNSRFEHSRIAVSSYWGGPVRDNEIVGNMLSSDSVGISFYENNPWAIDGTVLSNNRVLNNDIDVSGPWGIRVSGGNGFEFRSNNIAGAKIGIWMEWGGSFATKSPASPALFMAPVTDSLVQDNEITGANVGVLLGASARDNKILKNKVQGNSIADYVVDGVDAPFGRARNVPTFGPASGNTLEVMPGNVVLDFSGCSNIDECDPLDDDGDGLFGEDQADHLNNDGDTAFGDLPVFDEDSVEMPNLIFEDEDKGHDGSKDQAMLSSVALSAAGNSGDDRNPSKKGMELYMEAAMSWEGSPAEEMYRVWGKPTKGRGFRYAADIVGKPIEFLEWFLLDQGVKEQGKLDSQKPAPNSDSSEQTCEGTTDQWGNEHQICRNRGPNTINIDKKGKKPGDGIIPPQGSGGYCKIVARKIDESIASVEVTNNGCYFDEEQFLKYKRPETVRR